MKSIGRSTFLSARTFARHVDQGGADRVGHHMHDYGGKAVGHRRQGDLPTALAVLNEGFTLANQTVFQQAGHQGRHRGGADFQVTGDLLAGDLRRRADMGVNPGLVSVRRGRHRGRVPMIQTAEHSSLFPPKGPTAKIDLDLITP